MPILDSIDPAAAAALDESEKEYARRQRTAEMLGKGLPPAWNIPPALAGAADAASTYVAMKRGAKEANPLYKIAGGNPELTAGLAALLTAAQVIGANHLAKKGHRTAGKASAASKTAISTLVTAKNISNAKKLGGGKR